MHVFFPLTVWNLLLNYFINLNTTQHSEKLNLIIRQSAKEKKPDCSGCMFELNIDKVASESVCLCVRKAFVLRDGQQKISWDGNGKRSNERKTSIRERKAYFLQNFCLFCEILFMSDDEKISYWHFMGRWKVEENLIKFCLDFWSVDNAWWKILAKWLRWLLWRFWVTCLFSDICLWRCKWKL